MVAGAFKTAVFTRVQEGHDTFNSLVHHNDHGSQYISDNFTELLALHGVRVSIGSVGDAYDNALAETIIGAYKAELIIPPPIKYCTIAWHNKQTGL